MDIGKLLPFQAHREILSRTSLFTFNAHERPKLVVELAPTNGARTVWPTRTPDSAMELEDLDATCGVDNNMGGLDHYTIVQDKISRTSSCVWKYFGNLKRNNELVDEKHVYCTKCFDESKTKKYQKSTSTGNLIKHLKKAHNVQDTPSYRIKQENDRIVVTKEETTFFDDEGEADYYRRFTFDRRQSWRNIVTHSGFRFVSLFV